MSAPAVHGPARLPLRFDGRESMFELTLFDFDGDRWIAATIGDLAGADRVPVRIESACVFGHVFMSSQCDCRDQLHDALASFAAEGLGAVIYGLDQDARGLGTASHFDIYKMRQVEGLDTPEVFAALGAGLDVRTYDAPVAVLRALGLTRIELLTNNESRLEAVRVGGIDARRRAHEVTVNRFNMSTLFLEKEDLGYEWSFTPHREFADEVGRAPGPAYILRTGDEVLWRLQGEGIDLPGVLGRLAATPGPRGLWVLYTNDLPPVGALPDLAAAGVEVLVVPVPEVPRFHVAVGEAIGMKISDWARPGVTASSLDVWVPRFWAPALVVSTCGGRTRWEQPAGDLQDADPARAAELAGVPVPGQRLDELVDLAPASRHDLARVAARFVANLDAPAPT